MSIPKKGSRKITVDNVLYRWTIRHKPTYTQAIGQHNVFAAVELYENPGSVLSIKFLWVSYDPYFGVAKESVTPKCIKQCIEQAIKDGWRANENGTAFKIEHTNSNKENEIPSNN